MRQDIIRFESVNGEAEREWAVQKISAFLGTVRVGVIGFSDSPIKEDGRFTGEVDENFKSNLIQLGFVVDGKISWIAAREAETFSLDVKQYEDVLYVRYQVQDGVFVQITQSRSAHLFTI